MRSASEILDEIRKLKSLDSDTTLGGLFGVKQSTVASWRSRNTLPYENIIAFCNMEGISTDSLFFGGCIQQPVTVGEKPEGFQPELIAASLQPFLGLPLIIDEPELSIHPQSADAVHKLFNDMSSAERKIKRLSAKLERIVNEGDHKKVKLLEAQLEFLDPGVKNQNVVNEQNG